MSRVTNWVQYFLFTVFDPKYIELLARNDEEADFIFTFNGLVHDNSQALKDYNNQVDYLFDLVTLQTIDLIRLVHGSMLKRSCCVLCFNH